jgi:hypothetical protein
MSSIRRSAHCVQRQPGPRHGVVVTEDGEGRFSIARDHHAPIPNLSRSEIPAFLMEQVIWCLTAGMTAERHGVLAAVLRNFPAFQADKIGVSAAKLDALGRHRTACAYATMLRHESDALMAAAAGLPVAIVKGPVFAGGILSCELIAAKWTAQRNVPQIAFKPDWTKKRHRALDQFGETDGDGLPSMEFRQFVG